MPAYSTTNNAASTLSAAITTTGATSMAVTSAALFPSSGNYIIQIDTELLLVTGGQGTTTWTVQRGAEGSAAATHLILAPVTLIWTAATLLSWGGGDGAGGAPGYWPTLAPSGLTGATAKSRYVGATNSGSPVSGTFAVGDFIVDRSGLMWVCTAAGTPGTWVGLPAGRVSSAVMTTAQNVAGAGATLITALVVNFTALAGRRFRITASLPWLAVGAACPTGQLNLVEDNTTTVGSAAFNAYQAGAYANATIIVERTGLTAGAHQYYVNVAFGVTGNTVEAFSTVPNSLFVDDVGSG